MPSTRSMRARPAERLPRSAHRAGSGVAGRPGPRPSPSAERRVIRARRWPPPAASCTWRSSPSPGASAVTRAGSTFSAEIRPGPVEGDRDVGRRNAHARRLPGPRRRDPRARQPEPPLGQRDVGQTVAVMGRHAPFEQRARPPAPAQGSPRDRRGPRPPAPRGAPGPHEGRRSWWRGAPPRRRRG